jgi:hypothetical protein
MFTFVEARTMTYSEPGTRDEECLPRYESLLIKTQERRGGREEERRGGESI